MRSSEYVSIEYQDSNSQDLEARRSEFLERIRGLPIPPHLPREGPYCQGGPLIHDPRIMEKSETRESEIKIQLFGQVYCDKMHKWMGPWYIAEGNEAKGWTRHRP